MTMKNYSRSPISTLWMVGREEQVALDQSHNNITKQAVGWDFRGEEEKRRIKDTCKWWCKRKLEAVGRIWLQVKT